MYKNNNRVSPKPPRMVEPALVDGMEVVDLEMDSKMSKVLAVKRRKNSKTIEVQRELQKLGEGRRLSTTVDERVFAILSQSEDVETMKLLDIQRRTGRPKMFARLLEKVSSLTSRLINILQEKKIRIERRKEKYRSRIFPSS